MVMIPCGPRMPAGDPELLLVRECKLIRLRLTVTKLTGDQCTNKSKNIVSI